MKKLFKNNHASSVLNVCTRSAALISKLILTVYMSRYLSLEEIGLFGLVVATVGITNISIAFNFNFFSKREIYIKIVLMYAG